MTLKISILGAEHYHANFWTDAFIQSPDVEVVGVWDAEEARARELADRFRIDVDTDLAGLVGRSDAVAVCSATCDHAELVEVAASRKKPVLCEKPLSINRDGCRRIEEIVRAAGIPFMQSFPKRFDPVNREIAEILADGALGTVTLCRIRHGHSHGLNETFRSAWFTDPARSGGGTLLDEGVHAADFLRWMFGEPRSVFATVSSGALGLAVEDTAAAAFRYDSGMIAEVTTSWCFAGADASIEIYGTKGSLLLSGVDIASRPTREKDFLRIFVRDEQGGGSWSSSGTVPAFKTGIFHEHVAWAYVDALREGGPMPVTLADGFRAFAMIEAAYRSASSGKAEVIDYPVEAA